MVPGEAFSEVHRGEDAEDGQGNDFLYGLELRGGKIAVPHAVGGYLQAVFKEGYAPADENGADEGQGMVAQMSVPLMERLLSALFPLRLSERRFARMLLPRK